MKLPNHRFSLNTDPETRKKVFEKLVENKVPFQDDTFILKGVIDPDYPILTWDTTKINECRKSLDSPFLSAEDFLSQFEIEFFPFPSETFYLEDHGDPKIRALIVGLLFDEKVPSMTKLSNYFNSYSEEGKVFWYSDIKKLDYRYGDREGYSALTPSDFLAKFGIDCSELKDMLPVIHPAHDILLDQNVSAEDYKKVFDLLIENRIKIHEDTLDGDGKVDPRHPYLYWDHIEKEISEVNFPSDDHLVLDPKEFLSHFNIPWTASHSQ